MTNELPKREHTKVICFLYKSETFCVAEYFDGQFHIRRGEAQFAGIIEPDAWVAFPTPMEDGTLEDDKVHQMCYDSDESNEIKCIALNKEYTEDKLLILNDFRKSKPLLKEGQGWDGYAGEIRATFRPSAAILLKAWEDLLDDIDDNKRPNDYGK